ncbi:MAG: AAA family ATPase [Candidatus Pacebacteria bacterium]|nr:AAA family ATPase [Candidatus Paceibacterota bacterium]MDD3509774.1 AAA family ATPase [Candidatus Paceibacterota bacterium]MDD4664849.1 AAA family ATPase [Candidatus Paceibacterota bacterium]
MKIKSVSIKNYRSIKDSGKIKLTKLFAFIGQNNSGKSSILKAINILWGEDSVKNSDFHNDTDEDIEIEVILHNFNEDKYEELQDKEKEAHIKFVRKKNGDTEYFLNGNKQGKTFYKKLPRLLLIPDIRNPQNESTGGKGSYLSKLIEGVESGIDVKPLDKELADIKEEKIKDLNKKEINLYLSKKKEEEIEQISLKVADKLKRILKNDKISFKIDSNVKNYSYSYNSLISFGDSDNSVEILSSGTGIQSIYILSLLEVYAKNINDNDVIFLIEEPEVYLHPKLQRQMFLALREIASNNQVIFTTHSSVMISDVWANESIRLTALDNNRTTTINEIKIDEVINELGIKYQDFLNSRMLIFVEGSSDVIFYKYLISKHDPKINIDRNITFIYSDGFRNIHYYAFMQILTSQNVNLDFRIIVDGDGIDPIKRREDILKDIEKTFPLGYGKEEKKKKLKNIENNIYVLKKYSIESYFLNSNFLSKKFKNIKEEELEGLIIYYNRKYNEHVENLKISKNNFQEKYKPKHLFCRFLRKEAEENYIKIFKKESFLLCRDTLIAEVERIEKNGQEIIEYLLDDSYETAEKIFEDFDGIIKEIIECIKCS